VWVGTEYHDPASPGDEPPTDGSDGSGGTSDNPSDSPPDSTPSE
jgi:hypothetical protein